MERFDIVIIGAGISGLSMAHYCAKEGLKTLIIEKSERAGGTLHSHTFQDANGFWIELGAHTCYNSYRNLIEIIEDCRIAGLMVKREKVPFKMLLDNRIKSIPSQLNFLELFISAPRLFTLKKESHSIESYYSKIVGQHNFEKVFASAFNAVISQRANDFPADMLFKKRLRRKDIIKKFTFANGVQTIADSVALQKGIEFIKGKEIQNIEFKDSVFNAVAADGCIYQSNSLALAVSASSAARLLRTSFPEVSEQLSQIEIRTVESVGIAVKKEAIAFGLVAGLIPVNDSFFSVVARDTVWHDKYRGFTFHFKPGIMNHEMKLKRISEALGVRQSQLNHVISKENFVPSLKTGHYRLIADVDRLIEGKQLLLTGNYFNGLAMEDCVSRSLSEFYRLKKTLLER